MKGAASYSNFTVNIKMRPKPFPGDEKFVEKLWFGYCAYFSGDGFSKNVPDGAGVNVVA